MREAMKAIEAEAKERAGAKEASKAERAGADQDEIAQAVKQAEDKAHRPQGPAQLQPIPSRAS